MDTADHLDPVPGGAALTDRAVRRGMRFNIAAGALGNMWVAAALGVPLTMFMDLLGASGVLIGLTVTVQQVAMLLQVPSSLLAERLARRKPFWAALNLTQRLLWFIPAILPLFLAGNARTMSIITVCIVALSAVLSNGAAAAWWSWMADLIPERVRGRFW
jgi:MFS family permease